MLPWKYQKCKYPSAWKRTGLRDASLTTTGGILPTQKPEKHFYSAGIPLVLGIRSTCCYYRYCSRPLASQSRKRMSLFQMRQIHRPEQQLLLQHGYGLPSISLTTAWLGTVIQHYLHLPALPSVEGQLPRLLFPWRMDNLAARSQILCSRLQKICYAFVMSALFAL